MLKIPDWAGQQACEILNVGTPWTWPDDGKYLIVTNVARYLMAQAEPTPVDPMWAVVRAAVIEADPEALEAADFDREEGSTCKVTSEAFIDRLVAALRAADIGVNPPEDPKGFTHLVDAEGREVQVRFMEGPNSDDRYRWKMMGNYRIDKHLPIYCAGASLWLNADGKVAGYPNVRLIRKAPA
jgi:hypothetical protein